MTSILQPVPPLREALNHATRPQRSACELACAMTWSRIVRLESRHMAPWMARRLATALGRDVSELFPFPPHTNPPVSRETRLATPPERQEKTQDGDDSK